MYLAYLKTMLVEAVKQTFDAEYPEADFRDVHTSIEYPVDPQQYPGIWVDYGDTTKLKIAGIDHRETTEPDLSGYVSPYTRWKFQGVVSFTVVALTSLERDRLYDELVRVFAFGGEDPATSQFRAYIEANEFIASNINFDEIEPQGNAAAPGTPWGTDEIIYERTINLDILGEFVSDRTSGTLAPLSAINVEMVEVLGDLPTGGEPPGDGWH